MVIVKVNQVLFVRKPSGFTGGTTGTNIGDNQGVLTCTYIDRESVQLRTLYIPRLCTYHSCVLRIPTVCLTFRIQVHHKWILSSVFLSVLIKTYTDTSERGVGEDDAWREDPAETRQCSEGRGGDPRRSFEGGEMLVKLGLTPSGNTTFVCETHAQTEHVWEDRGLTVILPSHNVGYLKCSLFRQSGTGGVEKKRRAGGQEGVSAGDDTAVSTMLWEQAR